jgi:hypothetical protein
LRAESGIFCRRAPPHFERGFNDGVEEASDSLVFFCDPKLAPMMLTIKKENGGVSHEIQKNADYEFVRRRDAGAANGRADICANVLQRKSELYPAGRLVVGSLQSRPQRIRQSWLA